ncbi:hypothetical protein HUJ04_008283 [Dendroctonus ponderosae]|nr:hypothetical protein HUJ04_008283 [Dendroctonus ponderosae]
MQEIKRNVSNSYPSNTVLLLYEQTIQKQIKTYLEIIEGHKTETKETIQLKTITEETWDSNFGNLYADIESPEEAQETTQNDRLEEYSQITEELVSETVKKLKNRKIPDQDKIANKLIKYRGTAIIEEYTKLSNIIFKNRKIPVEWKKSISVPIFKKGDKTDPANYRDITLVSTSLKLPNKIIAEKLTSITPIHEEQQGFWKKRYTADAFHRGWSVLAAKHETTDTCRRYIVNLSIGVLNEDIVTEGFLISSEELTKTNIGERTIVDEIRTKQLLWYGHMQRMENKRPPIQMQQWNPNKRRKRGRPGKIWRQGIDSEMKTENLDI